MQGFIRGLALAAVLGTAIAAHAQSKILVQAPAAYEPDTPITKEAREECKVADLVAKGMLDALSPAYPGSVANADPSKAGPEWGVGLTIINLHGIGSDRRQRGLKYGHWSVKVRTDLYRDSKLVSSKTFERMSTFGQEPCEITQKVVDSVSKQAARWVNTQVVTGTPIAK